MPDETRHESADLEDYEVEDASDTLTGDPGDDPLDRGVATPERWSAGMRFGTTAGRLVAEDEGAHPDTEADLVARDAGIDGGAASAEEAAVHVVDEDDYDIRSED